MARLPYLDVEQLPLEQRDLLQRPINLYRQLAYCPDGLRNFQALGRWIRFESVIDARLREMAILQVGWLTGSEYEYSHHIKIGRDFGVSDDDILAIAVETQGGDSGLPALERTVLRAAREITGDGKIAADTFSALHETLGAQQVIELIITAAFYNAVVRILASLEIDVEADYRHFLDQHPLPQK